MGPLEQLTGAFPETCTKTHFSFQLERIPKSRNVASTSEFAEGVIGGVTSSSLTVPRTEISSALQLVLEFLRTFLPKDPVFLLTPQT